MKGMSVFAAEGVHFDRVFAAQIAQCTMYDADFINEQNREDSGDEEHLSGRLFDKIIQL